MLGLLRRVDAALLESLQATEGEQNGEAAWGRGPGGNADERTLHQRTRGGSPSGASPCPSPHTSRRSHAERSGVRRTDPLRMEAREQQAGLDPALLPFPRSVCGGSLARWA